MRKIGAIIICIMLAAIWLMGLRAGINGFLRISPRSTRHHVTVPTGKCPSALAVFNFRPRGDADAKYYAIAFARALADKTYCSPKHVTQQVTTDEISAAICRAKREPMAAISDNVAIKLGKKLAVAYVVSGDFTLSGNKASISCVIADTASQTARQTLSVSGTLAELPALQSKLAVAVVSAMKIKTGTSVLAELKRPNFTNSKTLILYGRSCFAQPKDCEALRWKTVEADPKAEFPVTHLLNFYKCGPSTCAELRRNSRLNQALSSSFSRFYGNSQIAILHGLLLAKKSRYKQAAAILQAVADNDPKMIRAHTALAYVGILRQDGQLALSESQKAALAWPNNAYLHAALSCAYSALAFDARHGHYSADMSPSVRRIWESNSEKSSDEARIAVKIDPDCSDGWFSVLDNGLQLSWRQDVNEAYKQLVRLEPTNVDVYTSYAFCFSPQWGGSDSEQEKVFAQAEKMFPRGSHKPLVVRALSLSSNFTANGRVGSPYGSEIQTLADEISRKIGAQSQDAITVRAQAYEINRRRPEFLQVSKLAYEKWGGLTWQYRYGMGCAFAYEDKMDNAYLRKALELFTDYRDQIPYDPRGYVQVGWCLSHLGRRAEAKAQFLKALQLDPANESAREKLKYVQ